jgi:hypothetical protein
MVGRPGAGPGNRAPEGRRGETGSATPGARSSGPSAASSPSPMPARGIRDVSPPRRPGTIRTMRPRAPGGSRPVRSSVWWTPAERTRARHHLQGWRVGEAVGDHDEVEILVRETEQHVPQGVRIQHALELVRQVHVLGVRRLELARVGRDQCGRQILESASPGWERIPGDSQARARAGLGKRSRRGDSGSGPVHDACTARDDLEGSPDGAPHRWCTSLGAWVHGHGGTGPRSPREHGAGAIIMSKYPGIQTGSDFEGTSRRIARRRLRACLASPRCEN